METFSALLVICAGNSSVTGEFPARRPVKRCFDVFFDLRLNEGWVSNREAGEWRRHRAHYDATVMVRFTSATDETKWCVWNRLVLFSKAWDVVTV